MNKAYIFLSQNKQKRSLEGKCLHVFKNPYFVVILPPLPWYRMQDTLQDRNNKFSQLPSLLGPGISATDKFIVFYRGLVLLVLGTEAISISQEIEGFIGLIKERKGSQ